MDLYPGLSYDTPVKIVWLENHKITIMSQMTTTSLRSGTLYLREERLRFSDKKVFSHSLRSGSSVQLFLSRVYPKTIMIIGQWSRNAFLWYIWIQVSNLSKGISDVMVSTIAFYTIPN